MRRSVAFSPKLTVQTRRVTGSRSFESATILGYFDARPTWLVLGSRDLAEKSPNPLEVPE